MKLGPDKKDIAVSLSKGALGAIPIVGPLVAEVVGTLIPNQRLDRIQQFLEELAERLQGVPQDKVESEFGKPEFVDLLEDGFYAAARALSQDRLKQIAALIAEGATRKDAEYIRYKKMLSLLNNLNDAEVLFLIMYGRLELGDEEFMNRHEDILYPKVAHSGSTQDEMAAAWTQQSYKTHLAELGVLHPRFQRPRRGELPEFDPETGMMKASGYELTRLGRMLLKYIGEQTIYDDRES